MNVLTDTWRGLVQRRLWPVALLLLAAAAAVPFLLASGEEEPLPNLPSAAVPEGDDTAGAQPIVAVASSAQREVGRDVVGDRKDPFRPAIKAVKGKPATTSSSSGGGAAKPADSGGSSSGGAGGGSVPSPAAPMTPVAPTTPVPATPRKRYEVATIAVRFGSSTSSRPVTDVKRLKALPSVAEPVLIYLGLRKDQKTAVFLADAGTVVQGDGRCLPSPENCQTVELRQGDTIFVDVETDAGTQQYQLDFVKVRRKRAGASTARRARTATAAGGREVLKSQFSRLGRWRYDEKRGYVRLIGALAHAADVERYQKRVGG